MSSSSYARGDKRDSRRPPMSRSSRQTHRDRPRSDRRTSSASSRRSSEHGDSSRQRGRDHQSSSRRSRTSDNRKRTAPPSSSHQNSRDSRRYSSASHRRHNTASSRRSASAKPSPRPVSTSSAAASSSRNIQRSHLSSSKRVYLRRKLQTSNRKARKESCKEFMTDITLENKLPAIPFPPKYVINPVIPGGPEGLTTYYLPDLDYKRNSLEEAIYQFPLLCGADVGCPLDFVDVAPFQVPPNMSDQRPTLHPADAELLVDAKHKLAAIRADLLTQHWVQQQTISENTVHSDHHHISQVEREAHALRKAKENERQLLEQYNDGRPRKVRIAEEFKAANSDPLPVHPTKGTRVKALRSWAVLPHRDLHGREFASIHFDHDYSKMSRLNSEDAAEHGFLIQPQPKKKKKRRSAMVPPELIATFYVPDEGNIEQPAIGTRLSNVESVKISINTNQQDSDNPFIFWWDPDSDKVRYSQARASIILSKIPTTTYVEPGVIERMAVVRPGERPKHNVHPAKSKIQSDIAEDVVSNDTTNQSTNASQSFSSTSNTSPTRNGVSTNSTATNTANASKADVTSKVHVNVGENSDDSDNSGN